MEDITPYKRLVTAMKEQEEEDKEFLQEATASIEELNLHNSIHAEEIVNLTNRLTYLNVEKFGDPANELSLDERGMSLNMGAALSSLYNYTQLVEDGGEQMDDLDTALIAIFKEKERRILNEI